MAHLVGSGYARPGQTGWDLLDSFALDVLLDVAYGMIVSGLDREQRAEVDRQLDELAEADSPKVEVELSDGRRVKVTEARLARIRQNLAGMAEMTAKGA